MSVRFYLDHNIHGDIVEGLRMAGVDVLTCLEDGRHDASDEELLERASALGRVMVSNDEDMLKLAKRRISER